MECNCFTYTDFGVLIVILLGIFLFISIGYFIRDIFEK